MNPIFARKIETPNTTKMVQKAEAFAKDKASAVDVLKRRISDHFDSKTARLSEIRRHVTKILSISGDPEGVEASMNFALDELADANEKLRNPLAACDPADKDETRNLLVDILQVLLADREMSSGLRTAVIRAAISSPGTMPLVTKVMTELALMAAGALEVRGGMVSVGRNAGMEREEWDTEYAAEMEEAANSSRLTFPLTAAVRSR